MIRGDPFTIREPCHADWEEMTGDAVRRFCGSCTKHVHDLSAMTAPAARRLLATEPSPCVRYTVGPDGRVVHALQSTRLPRPLHAGAPMSTNARLEARLRANIEDWDAWRVYGDWLLESGDIRGELVQLECRLRTRSLPPEEAEAVRRRIETIEVFRGHTWRDVPIPATATPRWRAGFLIGLELRFRPEAARVLERTFVHPTARFLGELTLSTSTSSAGAAISLVRSIRSESAVLSRARITLDLGGNGLDAEGARSVCSRLPGSVTALHLYNNRIGPAGARGLGRSSGTGSATLGSLTTLNLGGNALGDEGVEALAGAEGLRSLTSLGLWTNAIGADGARALAASPVLRSLTTLDLSRNAIGAAGLAALAASSSLGSLTTLDLESNRIGVHGALALAYAFRSGTARWPSLVTLNLDHNGIGTRGAAALTRALREAGHGGCRLSCVD